MGGGEGGGRGRGGGQAWSGWEREQDKVTRQTTLLCVDTKEARDERGTN